jgi:PncC family amidohydrolase
MSANDVISALAKHNLTVAVAESITGGAVLAELISVPGASKVVQGGVVCYSTQSKIDVLAVSEETINQFGAVSTQAAGEMAVRVAEKFKAEIGLATTGVAGPDLQEGKPLGKVHIAVSVSGEIVTQSLDLSGARNQIRAAAVSAAIDLLGKYSEK